MMGFVPLIVQGGMGQRIERRIKYFVVQAVGSRLILLGGYGLGFFEVLWFTGYFSSLFCIFCLFGLIIKLGVAPFH